MGWPGRLGRAGLFVAVAGSVVLIPGSPAHGEDGPTITFTAPDGECGSRPDPVTVSIAPSNRVTLVNALGNSATVDTGGKKHPQLDDGEAITVKFAPGEHDVRLIPDCDTPGAVAAVVIVVPPGDTLVAQSPSAPGPAPTGSGILAGPAGATRPSGSRPAPASGPAGETPTIAIGAVGTPSGPSIALTDSPANPGDSDEFGDIVSVSTDPHRVGLVGVVALICILGVVVGIIRSIRALRAGNASGRFI